MSLSDLFKSLKYALLPGESVADQAISSGIWMAVSNVGGRGLQLIKVVVLAQLLSPRAFGIFGIALLAAASLKWLSRPGIMAALVQKSESNVDEYLNTAFSMTVVRGIFLFTLLFATAPLVSSFFNEPGATDIIRVVGVAPLLTGLRNPGIMYLEKDLQFHKKFALNFTAELVNVSCAVAYALMFGTVWAFVFGLVSGRVVDTVGSYLIHPYRPGPEFNWVLAKDMIGYGKWITASGPLRFLLGQGDDAFVGWLLGASTLGLYRVAYRIGNAPGGEIADVINKVAFPAYSKLQDNPQALRKGYIRTLQLTMAIVLPATFGIVLVARPFVAVFFGNQWLPAVPALQLLAVYSAILAFGKINDSLMKAVGRPDVNTKIQFLELVLVAALIYPTTDALGLAGTAATITVAVAVARIPQLRIAFREINTPILRFIRLNTPPLVASLAMTVCVLGTFELIPTSRSVTTFVAVVIVGVIVYSGMILLFERFSNYQITGIVGEMFVEITA